MKLFFRNIKIEMNKGSDITQIIAKAQSRGVIFHPILNFLFKI